MAGFCKNIICDDRLFTVNLKNELVCISRNGEELLMNNCCDFDAVSDAMGCVHIAASETEGKLVYIRNKGERWGKGIVASDICTENIFVVSDKKDVKIFYSRDGLLCCRTIDAEIHNEQILDKISDSSNVFVTEDTVFYVNTDGELMKNGTKIYDGKGVVMIFAKGKEICFKDKDGVKIIDTEKGHLPKSLTRKHGEGAECPVLVHNGTDSKLHWIDGKTVFSAKRSNEIWQRLETESAENVEKVMVCKFCNDKMCEYDIGFLKNGEVYRWGEKEKRDENKVVEANRYFHNSERNLKAEFESMMKMEEILGEIKNIHKKITEINEKMGRIQKINTVNLGVKRQKDMKKSNLLKMYKK